MGMRRFFAVLRSLVVAPLFALFWLYYFPRWMGMSFANRHPAGWILIAIGAPICLACIWQFAWRGLGTPAPFDPPRRLVVSGPYRWVRNPMYLGFGLVMIGQAIVVASTIPLILMAIAAILVTLLILFFEEPSLRATFGSDYENYCHEVRRWIPRLRPYSFDNSSRVT